MKTQLELAIKNLEKVIYEFGFDCKNIVRLNIYSTSTEELWSHFSILLNVVEKNDMKTDLKLLEATVDN